MNILVTSVGRRAYIVRYFQEALAGKGLVHACNNAVTLGTQAADRYFIAPDIYSDDYIPCLLKYCRENDIDALLSLFDIDLLVLAKNAHLFEEAGTKVILAPPEFILKCNDKLRTAEFIESIGLRSPLTYGSFEDAVSAIEAGKLTFPVVVKPRWGMASMSVYFADDMRELEVFSAKANKEIMASYLKYESATTQDNMLVFQERLVGKEYGLDVINDLDSNYFDTFAKQKVTMRSGETDLGLTCEKGFFEEAAKKIAAASKHRGICSVDCFNVGGELYVVEMNCRISGHYPISHVAGLDFPSILVSWLSGEPINPQALQFEPDVYVTKDLVPMRVDIEK